MEDDGRAEVAVATLFSDGDPILRLGSIGESEIESDAEWSTKGQDGEVFT